MAGVNVLSDLTASQISQNYELSKIKLLQEELNAGGFVQDVITTQGAPNTAQVGSAQTLDAGLARAILIGNSITDTGVDTVCVGHGITNDGANSSIVGSSTNSTGADVTAVGKQIINNNGPNSCLFGVGVQNQGAQNCIFGHAAKNIGTLTHNVIYGNANETNGEYNTILGTGNKVLSDHADAVNKPKRNVIIADGVLKANIQTVDVGVQNCVYIGTHAPTGVLKNGSINLGTGANFAPATDNRLTFGGDALLDVLAGDGGVGGVGTDGYLRIRYKGTDFKIPLYADV